ncbi:helix-turn-helix domain-containing protein [Dokdonia ponticola]|uniref:Helix-turn-helix domain-containing protein n=1 Tax=Dokdonia ponticola TaxID=2041041 RepID=A0ABV9HTF3_9FLAO
MPEASFNTWTSLFLIVSAIGSFLSVLLFTDKNGRKNNWPIALIILGFSLVLVQYVLIWTNYRAKYPYVYFFDTTWYFLFGPLFYVYILKFYVKEYKVNFIHFIIPIIFAILSVLYFIKTKGHTEYENVNKEVLFTLYWSLKSPWVAIGILITYIIACVDFIKIHTPKKENAAIQMRTRWIRFLLFLFFLFVIAYISYYVLVKFSFFNPSWDYAISFTMAIGVYGIGYIVYMEPRIFNGELFASLFQASKKESNDLSSQTKDEFYNTLIQYIETSKPYLNNELRLVDVATEIGLTIHIVSQLINEKAHKNFNQFINEYRLKEAEILLQNNEDIAIYTMYYSLGFNSRTTFYKVFKNKHKCTPLEYQAAFKSKTLS